MKKTSNIFARFYILLEGGARSFLPILGDFWDRWRFLCSLKVLNKLSLAKRSTRL